jgi:hypothetical protein
LTSLGELLVNCKAREIANLLAIAKYIRLLLVYLVLATHPSKPLKSTMNLFTYNKQGRGMQEGIEKGN